jgi:hypothetical protein
MLGWIHESLTLKAKHEKKFEFYVTTSSLIQLPFYLPTYLPA